MSFVSTFGNIDCGFAHLPTRKFRLRYFCNSLERLLLGEKPNAFETNAKAMARSLTEKFPENNSGKHFDYRTWEDWFHGNVTRPKKLEICTTLGWPTGISGIFIEPFDKSPYINLFRALDTLAVFPGKTVGSKQGNNKVKAAKELLLALNNKWRPDPLGLNVINTAELLPRDTIHPRHPIFGKGKEAIYHVCSDDCLRCAFIDFDFRGSYKTKALLSTLPYLEKLLVKGGIEGSEVFHSLVIDTAACVAATQCLELFDEDQLLWDHSYEAELEALSAGMKLFFSPDPFDVNNAIYLFSTGHPWGNRPQKRDYFVAERVQLVRQSYEQSLADIGIESAQIQELVENAGTISGQ